MDNKIHTEIPNHFNLPRRISRLSELTYNLWWTWNPDAQLLYSLVDRALWEKVRHNPVGFLRQVERARLNAAISDRYYLDRYDRVFKAFDQYMKGNHTWFHQEYSKYTDQKVAYFSSEFGLHETIPMYAGGLGVLSGDTLKEASDLGIPMVGVTFFYAQGYFAQHITEDGWQESYNPHLELNDLPTMPIYDANDEPLTIPINLPDRVIYVRLWQIQVGRVPLYLLDTDVEQNSQSDRQLSARLYGADPELRILQEIILGIGGVRALRVLGIQPTIWHMNEGHSAFLALERAREYVAAGKTFAEAVDLVKKSNTFTTHTPVPAGNDEFPLWLIDRYFSNLWPELGLNREEFIQLALHKQPWGDAYSLPILAIHLSDHRNAVSELHGHVSRNMWHFLWPDISVEDVPIQYVTNGVHVKTWLARRLRMLYDRYFDPNWIEEIDDPAIWEQIENIPDAELWLVRKHLKRKLVNFMRDRARQQWVTGQVHPVQVVAAGTLLDPNALTIGFARRFATYKRANLILRDPDRLLRLLNQPNMPVQIIFAGKSHSADEPGKLLIQEVYRAVKNANNAGRLVFLEDYDMNIARYLVQGVDVWLNTPRRPNEASGTSGQKAALNGVLNFSVLDGWWREGFNGQNGWAIGTDTDYADPRVQDEADAASLYDTLENDIVPLFYSQRSADGLPGDWIGKMKESIRTLSPQFSSRRMMKEYVNDLYIPSIPKTNTLQKDEGTA
jgi:starch phosphorylase